MTAYNADRYSPNERVRVALPGDERNRRIGTVRRTFADAGDMVHVLDFDDGTTARYLAEELQALTTPPTRRRPSRPGTLPPLVRRGHDYTETQLPEQD